ncbi:FtsQ-type POTRA domain-containing protein [Agromyces mediolanus]|uniref:FtsQ-type POTRA domain-containing protein n=1 Tax=Agromyces mediolanus TaxID=41986 RepID=UPI0038387DE8
MTAPVPVIEELDPNATVPLGVAPLLAPARRGDAAGGAAAESAPAGAATPGGAAGPERPVSDPRAARKALAAAERARRRYERREVRRFTAHSRRRRRAWLIGIGAAALFVGGVLAIAYSPAMALREVRVEGASRIPPEQIQAAFAGELGTPLPLIGSGEVNTALRAFPLIETYSTELVPPGTLIVRITERTPVGVVQGANGLELVDAAGVVIDRPAERPEGQPLIEAGATNGAGFRAAAGVVRALPDDIRGQLVRVTAETADDVRLELSSGAAVVWGSADDSALKAVVLAGLMKNAPPDSVGQYDVSAPTSPVTE